MKQAALALVATLVASASACAGSVSGAAMDEAGEPLEGVHVEVVYLPYRADQLMTYGASIKATAITSEDGRYEIDISRLPPGEYAAHAYMVVENGGRQTHMDLVPDDSATFASTDQTVRNFTGGYYEFTEDNPYGNGGVFVVTNEIGDYTDLTGAEVTRKTWPHRGRSCASCGRAAKD